MPSEGPTVAPRRRIGRARRKERLTDFAGPWPTLCYMYRRVVVLLTVIPPRKTRPRQAAGRVAVCLHPPPKRQQQRGARRLLRMRLGWRRFSTASTRTIRSTYRNALSAHQQHVHARVARRRWVPRRASVLFTYRHRPFSRRPHRPPPSSTAPLLPLLPHPRPRRSSHSLPAHAAAQRRRAAQARPRTTRQPQPQRVHAVITLRAAWAYPRTATRQHFRQ